MRKPTAYVGIDTHKSFSYVTAIDSKGKVIKQGKLRNFKFEEFFKELSKYKVKIAIESTEMIMPLIRALESYGEIKVAHPGKLRLIAESKIKTDKIDSLVIAQLLRTNFMPESYIPSKEIRELRELCREHYSLKVMSTKIKNQIRHHLLAQGIITNENIFTKERRLWLRRISRVANRKLDILEFLENKIKEVDREIKEKTRSIEMVRLLTSIPGIGWYSASLLYAEIANIERFSSFYKLNAYFGLNPSVHQSGKRKYYGSITKRGNRVVRWVLIQCAYVAIKYDRKLREFYLRKKAEKGNNKAIVVVARKLLKRIYAVWKRRGAYEREPNLI